jgi:hypothetical protein
MKTLSERIAERAREKSACTSHSNRAIILALRNDIQQALEDGWSVLAVYHTLYDEGRVTFSYQAFRRYVNRIHLGKLATEKRLPRQPSKTVFKSSATPVSGFSFNSTPNKEELL